MARTPGVPARGGRRIGRMDLPVMPPVKPMLAKSVAKIPPGMQYEAKWDGFRAIVFRDGDEVEIGSRTGKPLTRYFPELVDALRGPAAASGASSTARSSSPTRAGWTSTALTERIHPADSRVRMLAERTPAWFVAFDLLALGDESLLRRAADRPAGRCWPRRWPGRGARCTWRRRPRTSTWRSSGSSSTRGRGSTG